MPEPDLGYDPDFMAGLTQRVLIQVDTNAAGTTKTAHGSAQPNWQTLSGQTAVPCFIGRFRSRDYDQDGKPGVVTTCRILFGPDVPRLDRRHKLVKLDRTTLQPVSPAQWFLVDGETDPVHDQGHHQSITAIRHPL